MCSSPFVRSRATRALGPTLAREVTIVSGGPRLACPAARVRALPCSAVLAEILERPGVLTGAEAALPYVFMSTYYVTNADKDDDGVITDLKASKDSQTATGTIMKKKALIDLIETDGHSAKTYNAGKSEDIRVVSKKFLRTDSNSTEADNLGSLPKISR